MKIEIVDETVTTREVTPQNGKNFTIREQQAYLHGTHKYPLMFKMNLTADAAPYKPGMYTLGDDAFYINRYGSLTLSRMPALVKV